MNEINFEINDIEEINLSMDVGIKEIYPPIENLEVTPTKEKQMFTHEGGYGYDNVTVDPIPEEYIIPDGTLPITENATYDVRRFAKVTTSVHPTPNLQDKEVTPTKDIQTVVADEEYDGLSIVEIKPIPENYIEPTGTIEIKTKGTHDVTQYANAEVDILPTLQDKEVTPTKESQTITSDEGYDGLNNVVVNPIPNNYIEPNGTIEITSNGTHNVKEYENANINVPEPEINLQSKSVEITENGTQNITADAGYDGLNNIEITTNVPGGVGSTSIEQACLDARLRVKNEFTATYNKTFETTEEQILYTPDINYPIYAIVKMRGGDYLIRWFPSTVAYLYQYSNTELRFGDRLVSNNTSDWLTNYLYSFTQLVTYTVVYCLSYESTGYATVDDAIAALKSSSTSYHQPSSSTQYRLSGTSVYESTDIAVAVCNCRTIGKNGTLGACTRQISSNETIMVIPTE